MAENVETTNTVETETSTNEQTPSIEELMTRLAQKDADYAKLKNSFDTASSELAATKKQLRTKMTAEEQIEEEKRIADEAKDNEIKELKDKFRKMDYSKRYMGIGLDEKTAESLSELTGELTDADSFFSALGKFITDSNKTAKENAVQELIKNNPDINAGSGNTDPTAWVGDMAKDIAGQKNKANKSIIERYV